MDLDYQVLLFYHYVKIENEEEFKEKHLRYTKSLGLRGRVFVSKEGINGTVSGTIDKTNEYMEYLKKHPLFQGITFKIDLYHEHVFDKMHVRVKKELVNLRLKDDIDPTVISGKSTSPKEFYEGLIDPNAIIIDARNTYEYDLGHFKGAIRPNIKYFRELPEWINNNQDILENKKIYTYCTGGIRCEKFSGYLKKLGYDDVYKLDGGIANYAKDKDTLGKLWLGKMYVFDKRISVFVNKHEHTIVGKDYFTKEPCERYINCANPECNKQIICSVESEIKHYGSCSYECMMNKNNRYIKEHNITTIDKSVFL